MLFKLRKRTFRKVAVMALCLWQGTVSAVECDGLLGGGAAAKPVAPLQSYDDLITEPPGPAQLQSITLGSGRQLTIEIKRQAEFERRVNLPDATKGTGHISQNSGETIASRLLQIFYPAAFESIKVNSYGGAIASDELWLGGFQLAPLSSRFEQFHNPLFPGPGRFPPPRKTREWKLGVPIASALVQEIYGGMTGLRQIDRLTGVDHVETKFLVGWQNEVALYFDTRERSLAGRGVAVRLKAWFPKSQHVSTGSLIPSTAEIKRAIRFSLTIKITHNEVGPFTQREEIHVALPADASFGEISEIAQIMVARIPEANASGPLNLNVVSRVDTERLAVNLIERSASASTKVGFLTIDSFRRADISSSPVAEGPAVWSGPVRQLEIELLPEFAVDLLQSRERLAELEKLFAQIEKRVGGVVTPTPKYLQPMPKAEK